MKRNVVNYGAALMLIGMGIAPAHHIAGKVVEAFSMTVGILWIHFMKDDEVE